MKLNKYNFYKIFSSFLKENSDKNDWDIQKEVPIKSANSFLYEYWNVFFYLYSKKLLEKFKQINSETVDTNLLDSLSINNIFRNENDNFFQTKDNNKDSLQLSNNNSNNNLNNQNNFSSSNNIKSSLFFPQNNNINLPNNYIYQKYPQIISNSKNELFINQVPNKPKFPSNLNMNNFYAGTDMKNSGNDNKAILGDMDNKNNINNLESNATFFPISIQNPILPSSLQNPMSTNNISNNFLINNNTNSNINIRKNINNIINNNIINNNINNNGNIIDKNEIIKNNNLKYENNNLNKKNFNSKDKKIINLFTVKEQQKKLSSENTLNKSPKNHKKSSHLFEIKETSVTKEGEQKDQLVCKKRKRFLKNNKLVFIQLDGENDKNGENNFRRESENDEENINVESLNSEKMSELINKNKKPRGSRFRGVSKNGSQWQVLIMVKKKKRYLGSFYNEEEAAKAYDKVALQHHGIKAKTNFNYTKEEVEEIMASPKLLKLD